MSKRPKKKATRIVMGEGYLVTFRYGDDRFPIELGLTKKDTRDGNVDVPLRCPPIIRPGSRKPRLKYRLVLEAVE